MIDFTSAQKLNKAYSGANGAKISVVYDGNVYMLKFPSQATKNDNLSYANGCISEHIGCNIFNILGFDVQETLLGTYETTAGDKKIVVACKDFTMDGRVLQDFGSLKNQIVDSERNGYGTELGSVMQTIENQTAMDPIELEEHFWNMFVVDAFIGNWDRHNGNWGFLYDIKTDQINFAPIFDCGSSLYPQADIELMQRVLDEPTELNKRIYQIPTSALTENGRRIVYYDFMTKGEYAGCDRAILRIVPEISNKMSQITTMINTIDVLSEVQKNFYNTMLVKRKEKILDVAYEKINERILGESESVNQKSCVDKVIARHKRR